MKQKDEFEGIVDHVDFPNKGVVYIEGEKIRVTNAIEGQKVRGVITKKRQDRLSGLILETVERSPDEVDAACNEAFQCGGCLYQTLPYQKQTELKQRQVKKLLEPLIQDHHWEEIEESPLVFRYRNKMEYSFGDAYKGGPLALGLHKRGTMYDIVDASDCKIVTDDFNKILKWTIEVLSIDGLPFYAKRTHIGYLRHLVLRRGEKTGEILVNLITSSQVDYDLTAWVDGVKGLKLSGKVVGILNTINDELADAVKVTRIDVLEGRDYYYDGLFDMTFKISPFSFFQTNTLGAEKLYDVVRGYVGETKDKVVFDLYCGTGTITQMLAPVAKKAVGVELVPEAVEAARENAQRNGLSNCEFIAGDVLKVLDDLKDKPDVIVLDPPRDGIHPKALEKIIAYGVEQLVYVSCKPTSLKRDLEVLLANGYEVIMARCVDLFPMTTHVETIVLLELP